MVNNHRHLDNDMARRYPVEKHLRILSSVSSPNGTYVNISDECSKLNHRLYRQGMLYDATVRLDPDSTDTVDVYVLADTWMNNEAWKLAFKKYLENNEHDSIRKSRWSDFRVDNGIDKTLYARGNATSAGSGTGTIVQETGAYTVGEFDNSQVTTTAGNQLEFAWEITGASQYGLLIEYDRHGNTDPAPSTVITTTPYEGLNDDTENAQYEHMQEAGNNPPYNGTGGLGNPWVKVATLRANSPNANRLTATIKALCGFVLLHGYNETSTPQLTIELKKGDYKGVSAEPIGVMKRLKPKGEIRVV
jgi:hypothetical protein